VSRRASGNLEFGVWQIIIRRQAGDELLAEIKLVEADGQILWLGGSGGPLLWPGRILNVGSGGQDTGPYEVDVKVPAHIQAVTVTTADGELEVPLQDSDAFPGIRFGLLLLNRDQRISHVTAYDRDGQQADLFDMNFHQRVWHGAPQ